MFSYHKLPRANAGECIQVSFAVHGTMLLQDWIKSEALHPMPYPRWQAAFVLKYGRAFNPYPHPAMVKPGKPNECFANCQRALAASGLIYCEGYALQKGASRPSHHAWLTTPEGQVVDLTWTAKKLDLKRGLLPVGVEYFGVPFKTTYVLTQSLRTRMYAALLENIDEGSLWRESPRADEFLAF